MAHFVVQVEEPSEPEGPGISIGVSTMVPLPRQAMRKFVVKLGSVSAPLSAPSHYIDSCLGICESISPDYACGARW